MGQRSRVEAQGHGGEAEEDDSSRGDGGATRVEEEHCDAEITAKMTACITQIHCYIVHTLNHLHVQCTLYTLYIIYWYRTEQVCCMNCFQLLSSLHANV